MTVAGPRAHAQAPTAPPREELNIPTGERMRGTVRIPVAVLADGKPVSAGRYRVRLTGEAAERNAVGQLKALERWIEFVQQSDVKGRTMASVVPAGAVKQVAEGRPPAPGQFRVQRWKGDDYLRLWYNLKGDQILIHLPVQPRAASALNRD